MPTLRLLRSVVVLSTLTVSFLVSTPAVAQDEVASLNRAIELFEAGDYLTAQELLTGIDRDQLTAEQQSLRDDFLNRTQVALRMYEKAQRDLEDAETAIAESEADRARSLLSAVLANEYAPEAVRNAALAHQRELERGAALAQDEGAQVEPAGQETEDAPDADSAVQPVAPKPDNSARARTLTRDAGDMLRAGRYNEAERLFQEALDLVPGHPEAIDGLRQVALHEEVISGPLAESLIERIKSEDRIRWQRTVAEYRDVEQTIRRHAEAERFGEANQLLVRAGQIVEAGRQFSDPVTKYEGLRAEADALGEWLAVEERSYNQSKVAEIQRQIEQQREERQRQDAENRRRQVDALMSQAVQHRKDGDLDAALTVLKQVTIIDPRYEPARWMTEDVDDLRAFRKGREARDEFYKQSRGALIEVEIAKIPWHQELLYPDDWPELITRPERGLPGARRGRSGLFAALDKPVSVDFVREPFEEVIERFVDAHRLNIIVNWNDLKQGGVDSRVAIDLNLPNEISLRRALTEVLGQAGAGTGGVGFEVVEDTIRIAMRATLDRETFTAVYDISDLLMEIPNFKDSPMTDLREANERSFSAMTPAATRVRAWAEGDDDDDEGEEDPQRERRVQTLIDLIQETVAPTSWRDRGGMVGTIEEFNGQLVVTQNSSAQRRIADLLGKLREQRAIQIAIEARFITVSSHYLEELGIDIDIVLNSGNAGFDYIPGAGGPTIDPVLGNALLLPRTFSQLGFTPAVPNMGVGLLQTPGAGQVPQPYTQAYLVPQMQGGGGSQTTPIPIINRSTNITDISNLGSDIPGSFAGQAIAPAFSLFGSFLDNIQVDFLIRATQADSRTAVLTAPQIVLFNGQRSWVAVTIQQNYVTTLQPVVAQGAAAQAPQVGVIDSGAVLDVEATITADKRYVTMTVRPGVTRLLDLQTIPFSGGTAGGGFGAGAALPAFVQLPTLSSQRIQTTVTVPDGGTLLIGGQKLASETEIEAGVPILSKIPILKRIYSSRSMVKDEQTLLILIKPKILIQTEQEELAFPSFSGG